MPHAPAGQTGCLPAAGCWAGPCSGRARYRRLGPFAKSRGRRCGRWRRVTPRRSSAAEAPAVAPDAPPAWAEIAATPAPGSAMPSRSASAGDRGQIGWRHRLCAHRAKRLGIVRCERDHQPQAGCCKQNGLLHALSPLISFLPPGAQKSVFRRETQSIAPQDGACSPPSALHQRGLHGEWRCWG